MIERKFSSKSVRKVGVNIPDNASYYNAEMNFTPTSHTEKEDIIRRLVRPNIPCSEKTFKPEL